MRACVQRVSRAEVRVDGKTTGQIEHGLVVLLGVAADDTERDASYLAEKVVNLRIFNDEQGKMNRSLFEVQGSALVISQFTLLGDCRHGRRPSYTDAAPPEMAETLYEAFVQYVRHAGIAVSTGIFRAMMQVELVNDGPVTLVVESVRK